MGDGIWAAIHGGRRILVVEPALVDLKRGGQVEDRPAPLDRHHPAGGEAFAVADAVDVVDDGPLDIARPQKIGVQAVGPALRRHGLVGGGERLAEHLAAVDVAEPQVLALAAENVLLDRLELEQGQQLR